MQLDTFLCSAKQYAPYASVTVLWHASDDLHRTSYGRVRVNVEYEAVWWNDQQIGFAEFVDAWLDNHERVVFHTDDDVFFTDVPEWMTHPGIDELISLRLGYNTTLCQPTGRKQEPPKLLYWRWRDEEGDFGYPLTLNGTVYRSADLLPLLDFPFTNPTELEAGLAANAERFGPQWMTAPLHSCCVSLPHNRVSVSSGCPAGSVPEWQPEALREAFLEGWRIDLEAMDFSAVVGAHQEIPLEFRRLQAR